MGAQISPLASNEDASIAEEVDDILAEAGLLEFDSPTDVAMRAGCPIISRDHANDDVAQHAVAV